MSHGNVTCGIQYFHKRIQQVTHEIRHGAMHGQSFKNEVLIERYCSRKRVMRAIYY